MFINHFQAPDGSPDGQKSVFLGWNPASNSEGGEGFFVGIRADIEIAGSKVVNTGRKSLRDVIRHGVG